MTAGKAALFLLLAFSMSCLTQAHGQSYAQPKRVMMLHSFGPLFKPWSDYEKYVRSEIARGWKGPVDFLDQSLVNARTEDENAETIFADYLLALYANRPADIIVAIGAPAAAFVQRFRDRLFPGTPIVFTAVEQRRIAYDKLTANDAVVAVAHDFPAIFDNILRVLPATETIAIINGASPNERFWLKEMKRELAPLGGRVELRWYEDESFEQILANAATLPPHSAIFWHLMNVDAAGIAHEANDALSKLASVANAPIFSYDTSFFGDAIVGGPMHSVQKVGQITASVAIRILSGEKAGNIKIEPSRFASPVFDSRQLERWNIRESDLPDGSTVYFRQPTIWEQYRWQLAIVTAIVLLQTALISILLHERRRRRSAEVYSRQRMAELAHVNRLSTAGELTASIAHELNQPLSAILTNAETAGEILKSSSPDIPEVREIISDIIRDDRRAADVIRSMRTLLKKTPFELKRVDLNEVVEEAVRLFSSITAGRDFEMNREIAPRALPVLADPLQLQQIILNLAMNALDAMKDTAGDARIIDIRTKRSDNFAELSVSDHGTGIPEDKLKAVFEPFYTSKAEGMGMGLAIVRTIVEAHSGEISAENLGHGGACFRIRIPLDRG